MLFFQFVRNPCIERQTKTTQPIKKLFLLIDSWIANYQVTKCVLHLDYASKPKNSTEAIYEWNPQLLSCQPNISNRTFYSIFSNISLNLLLIFIYRDSYFFYLFKIAIYQCFPMFFWSMIFFYNNYLHFFAFFYNYIKIF